MVITSNSFWVVIICSKSMCITLHLCTWDFSCHFTAYSVNLVKLLLRNQSLSLLHCVWSCSQKAQPPLFHVTNAESCLAQYILCDAIGILHPLWNLAFVPTGCFLKILFFYQWGDLFSLLLYQGMLLHGLWKSKGIVYTGYHMSCLLTGLGNGNAVVASAFLNPHDLAFQILSATLNY